MSYPKIIPILVLGIVALFIESEARPQLPEIPREFKSINLETYLRNERAMKFQFKCILYNGPCDTIGKFLKKNIPIYLRTQCKNCDDEQKKLGAKFIKFLQDNYPKEYDDALKTYGKGIYTPEEEANFEKEFGVKLRRDPNAPTKAPGTKPDVDGLVKLVKEGQEALKNTKAPLILGSKDSATTVIVTLPPDHTTPKSR